MAFFLFNRNTSVNHLMKDIRCVKSVYIRSFSWSVFSRIRTEYNLSVFNPNAGKYGPEKNPYLDTFHAVISTGLDQFSVGYDNIVL